MSMITQMVQLDDPGQSCPLAVNGARDGEISARIATSASIAYLAIRGLSQQIGEIGCRDVFVTIAPGQGTSRTTRALPTRGGFWALVPVPAGEQELHLNGAETIDYLSIRGLGPLARARTPDGAGPRPVIAEDREEIETLVRACTGRLRDGDTSNVIRSLQRLPAQTARTVVAEILCALADDPDGMPGDTPLFLQILAGR